MKKGIISLLCLAFFFSFWTIALAKPVRIGVLPIVDALPLYVAQEKGFFGKLSRPVTLVTFRSAVERDAAFQTGKLDAYLGDLISAALLRSRGFPARAVSVILGQKPSEGLFAILSSPDSSIRTVQDLRGKHVAISSNTIIEYVLDGLLKANGLPLNVVQKEEIKSIPIRFQMLMNNKIDAAVLPDPLASLARFKGAHWVADDGRTNLSQTVLVWNDHFIKTNRQFLKRFYRSYEEAVAVINRNHDAVRPLLVQRCHLPKPIAHSFRFADFPFASPPSPKMARSVLNWLKHKKLLKSSIHVRDFIAPPDFIKTAG